MWPGRTCLWNESLIDGTFCFCFFLFAKIFLKAHNFFTELTLRCWIRDWISSVVISNNQIPTKHLVADFESNIHKIDEDKRNAARLKFMNCISNFSCQRRTHTTSQNEMTQDIKSTTIFFKNSPNILIIKADKGNTTVALDKTKYLNEIKTMLSDSSTYIPLKKDPTNTTQKKLMIS